LPPTPAAAGTADTMTLPGCLSSCEVCATLTTPVLNLLLCAALWPAGVAAASGPGGALQWSQPGGGCAAAGGDAGGGLEP
jgi:hypothetical protein